MICFAVIAALQGGILKIEVSKVITYQYHSRDDLTKGWSAFYNKPVIGKVYLCMVDFVLWVIFASEHTKIKLQLSGVGNIILCSG